MQAFRFLIAALVATIALSANAAGLKSFEGKAPSHLLKQEKPFAKAYRAAIKDQELPDWVNALSVGHPAEIVDIGGKKLILTSACNPNTECLDERFYLLYDPADQSIIGFFFLAPDMSAPGDHRMALSRWIAKKPAKERTDFLLNRALKDAMPSDQPAAAKPAN